MPHISQSVIDQSIKGIDGLLNENMEQMEQAYCNDEDALTVSIKLKYSVPSSGNGIQIDTDLSFTLEKIKAKTTTVVDPNKDSLFKVAK
jgi:hypothetical protein